MPSLELNLGPLSGGANSNIRRNILPGQQKRLVVVKEIWATDWKVSFRDCATNFHEFTQSIICPHAPEAPPFSRVRKGG
jgi:hypothetical protein